MKFFSLSKTSIRKRLPILICGLLLAVILVFGSISYIGIRKASMKVGHDRLEAISDQFGAMLATGIQNRIRVVAATVDQPAVKLFINSGGRDSIEKVSKILGGLSTDSMLLGTAVLDKDFKNLLPLTASEEKLLAASRPASLASSLEEDDKGRFGKLQGADTMLYYPIILKIADGQAPIGYVLLWRRFTTSGTTTRQLSNLVGANSKFYTGNSDGSLWTDLQKQVSFPSSGIADTGVITSFRHDSNETVVAKISHLPDSDWLYAITLSKFRLLKAARQYLYWLIFAALLIIAVGVVMGINLSRNISKPLQQLTSAASSIAAGNFTIQPPVERFDELGKLARAFNAMSSKLKRSQELLKKEAENYRFLFESNPMPMFIVSRATLDIIDVNRVAVAHYGYTREEFLQLSAMDLRPKEDVPRFLEYILSNHSGWSSLWRHKKKDGTIIMVEVISENITYRDTEARLVLANDVTERLKLEAELVRNRIQQQQLITETTIEAQEKEREEIGRELHDNINQILTSTKLYLELASADKEMLGSALSKSQENISLAINEIRQLSKRLVPPQLNASLKESLSDLVTELKSISPVDISLEHEAFDEGQVSSQLKLTVYRIVQEQLNNIVKHAKAGKAEIHLKTENKTLILTIHDNGIGFDVSQRSKGLGLRNIDNRVKFYNGKFEIQSEMGKGCEMSIEVPLGQGA